jgi:translation initiation factor IF-3
LSEQDRVNSNTAHRVKKPLKHYGFAPWRRYYSTAVSTKDVSTSDAVRLEGKKKPKTMESPKIMLISETNSISVVTLEEAHKIAERKSLHLVPGEATNKTDKPVYKLLTNADFVKLETEAISDTDAKEKKKEKEVKTLILRNKTADNDVLSKARQMNKWIEKGHIVRVMIGQPGEQGDPDHIYKLIEENMKETGARFLQKIVKPGQIRFQVNPPKEVKLSKKAKAEAEAL